MKTWKCSDGFVTKIIEADSAVAAANAYALITTDVDVVEVDSDGAEIGKHQTVSVSV